MCTTCGCGGDGARIDGVVHGHHDPVVKWNSVRKFADRLGSRVHVHDSSDCGQLIYYSSSEKVFSALQQALADNKNVQPTRVMGERASAAG